MFLPIFFRIEIVDPFFENNFLPSVSLNLRLINIIISVGAISVKYLNTRVYVGILTHGYMWVYILLFSAVRLMQ